MIGQLSKYSLICLSLTFAFLFGCKSAKVNSKLAVYSNPYESACQNYGNVALLTYFSVNNLVGISTRGSVCASKDLAIDTEEPDEIDHVVIINAAGTGPRDKNIRDDVAVAAKTFEEGGAKVVVIDSEGSPEKVAAKRAELFPNGLPSNLLVIPAGHGSRARKNNGEIVHVMTTTNTSDLDKGKNNQGSLTKAQEVETTDYMRAFLGDSKQKPHAYISSCNGGAACVDIEKAPDLKNRMTSVFAPAAENEASWGAPNDFSLMNLATSYKDRYHRDLNKDGVVSPNEILVYGVQSGATPTEYLFPRFITNSQTEIDNANLGGLGGALGSVTPVKVTQTPQSVRGDTALWTLRKFGKGKK